MNLLKVALCQLKVGDNKWENIDKARSMIRKAADGGAKIILLPEMFTCPYELHNFPEYAENVSTGETIQMLAQVAAEKSIYIVGGSIPEIREDGGLYNTCPIVDSKGKLIGIHRKVHLFDIKVKNGINFTESAVLSPGNVSTCLDTPWGKIGVIICYDIRFPEFVRLTAEAGAKMIFVPAAFNMTTGPAHWEVLFRSRALDNEVFMLGCSPREMMPDHMWHMVTLSLLAHGDGWLLTKEKEY